MREIVRDMAGAIRSRTALPPMPSSISLLDAYELQKQLVDEVAGGEVAGLKAGMTAAAGQKAYGLTHPLIGSLYSWGALQPNVSFAAEPGVNLECEIGFRVNGAGEPKTAGPVIEIPRIVWNDPDEAIGVNLCACNIAADRYIVGEQQALRGDYDNLGVKLTRDGETVCEAPLTDALGGPYEALKWMLNEATTVGLTLADDMLLITGACGGIHPAEPGSYVADYGVLGSIAFTVT